MFPKITVVSYLDAESKPIVVVPLKIRPIWKIHKENPRLFHTSNGRLHVDWKTTKQWTLELLFLVHTVLKIQKFTNERGCTCRQHVWFMTNDHHTCVAVCCDAMTKRQRYLELKRCDNCRLVCSNDKIIFIFLEDDRKLFWKSQKTSNKTWPSHKRQHTRRINLNNRKNSLHRPLNKSWPTLLSVTKKLILATQQSYRRSVY